MEPAAAKQILDYVSTDRPQPDWAAATAEVRARFPDLSFTSEQGWRRFAQATYREGADGRLHFDWDVNLTRPFRQGRERPRDCWPLFRALGRVPVLAIRGGRSQVLGEETFARMAREKPDLVQLTLPGVGHVPTLEEPEAERAVDELLARIDG